eukprot:3332230-Ditylum_brightwellii.AAC.1
MEQFMEMIAFGMKTTLGVVDETVEMEDEDNNGLAIGAYEASCCMDAAAAFVFKMCKNIIDRLRYAELWEPPGIDGVPTMEETQEEEEEEEMLYEEWKKW